jgi:hypothetical protein
MVLMEEFSSPETGNESLYKPAYRMILPDALQGF